MTKKIYASMLTALSVLFFTSCVPTKKFKESQAALASARNDSALLDARVRYLDASLKSVRADSAVMANKISGLQGNIADLNGQIDALHKEISELDNKAGQLSKDAANKQSQLSKSQQELANQQKRLEQLQALMDQQKKAILEIRRKMSDALVGFNSNELTVAIKNGKVYVSLQENLLFPSGSAVVNTKGKEALGKLAEVLNINPDITVDIEGHTDSIPIRGKYQDNWDLSLARSAAIVRILTIDYKVDPLRVIASGHSQYDPVQSNSTPAGRALNRRTEIILSPKLDELYKLLESTPDSQAK
ncbi:MAG: OmpA family protein [Puia sp.]|nr:OmpA family protein [Puia sp.]